VSTDVIFTHMYLLIIYLKHRNKVFFYHSVQRYSQTFVSDGKGKGKGKRVRGKGRVRVKG